MDTPHAASSLDYPQASMTMDTLQEDIAERNRLEDEVIQLYSCIKHSQVWKKKTLGDSFSEGKGTQLDEAHALCSIRSPVDSDTMK